MPYAICISLDLFTQSMYKDIIKLMNTAHALCEAGHFATERIRKVASALDKQWRAFADALAERSNVLNLAVAFYAKADEVIRTSIIPFCPKTSSVEVQSLFTFFSQK